MNKQNKWEETPCIQCGGTIFCRILDGNTDKTTVIGDGCITCGLIRPVPYSKKIEVLGVEQQVKSPEGRAVIQLLAIAEGISFTPEQRIEACRAILYK